MANTVTATVQLPLDALLDALASRAPVDRHRSMVTMYGEACSKATAAKIIGCSAPHISALLEDGRIQTACEGTKVDVRSLADYIERKPEIDRHTRLSKKYGRRSYV